MRKGWGFAALVVGLLAAAPEAWADWRVEFRSGPDHRHRHYDSWGRPFHPVRQRCWSEFHPGLFGYTEVVRCAPVRHRHRHHPPGWGPPPGYFWGLR